MEKQQYSVGEFTQQKCSSLPLNVTNDLYWHGCTHVAYAVVAIYEQYS